MPDNLQSKPDVWETVQRWDVWWTTEGIKHSHDINGDLVRWKDADASVAQLRQQHAEDAKYIQRLRETLRQMLNTSTHVPRCICAACELGRAVLKERAEW